MTVETTSSKQTAQQMGVSFDYDFTLDVLLKDPTEEEALKSIKAKVKLADPEEPELTLVYGTDYTVVLNKDRSGGTLTVVDKRTTDDYITIYREYDLTQEADYQDFNALPAETLEQCFDKLTMLEQQHQEVLDRCLKVDMTSDVEPSDFAFEVNRIYESIDNIDTVADIKEDVQTVAEVSEDVTTCAENIEDIKGAKTSAENAAASATDAATSEDNAEVWAEGTDEEVQALGGVHSSKGWAEQSAQGQIQSDLAQVDTTQKDYVKNKLIENLDNVELTDLQDGQFLGYDEVENKFVNKDIVIPEPESQLTKFSVNNGKITNGVEDILINNSNELAFNVSNENPITYTNCNGETFKKNYLNPINVTGYDDGVYNCFLNSTNQPYLLKNNIYYLKGDVENTNLTIIGNPTISNGVVSNFSTTNYLKLPQKFQPSTKTWEFLIDYMTSATLTSQCALSNQGSNSFQFSIENAHAQLTLSSNGSTWDIINSAGSHTLTANTHYQFKISFTGTQYKVDVSINGGNFENDIIVNSTASIYQNGQDFVFGLNRGATSPFLGSINLKESYIKFDDEYIWQYGLTNGNILLKKVEPLEAYKRVNNELIEFTDVPNGKVTISGGKITSIEQPIFNQNKAPTNEEYIASLSMPDYKNGVQKTWNTIHTATKNCYVTILAIANSSIFPQIIIYDEDGNPVKSIFGNNNGELWSTQMEFQAHCTGCAFIAKGYSYKAVNGVDGFDKYCMEYPLKGVN